MIACNNIHGIMNIQAIIYIYIYVCCLFVCIYNMIAIIHELHVIVNATSYVSTYISTLIMYRCRRGMEKDGSPVGPSLLK